MQARPARILPLIVVSQFAGTSLWFAGNTVMGDLQREWQLGADALGHVTSAVQRGFIVGTLVFALLSVADRVCFLWLAPGSILGLLAMRPILAAGRAREFSSS